MLIWVILTLSETKGRYLWELKKCYENEIEEEKKKAIEIINIYIELSHINWKELDNAYGRLEFLFGNSKIRKNTYEKIVNLIRNIINKICQEAYHFELWKKGQGNFVVCVNKVLELNDIFFESKISEYEGITSESIYQTEFDDIEESLETFRTKIYWSSKKDKVDRHPVQSRLVKMNPTKS